MEANDSTPDAPPQRRTAALQLLAQRFKRRWVSGLIVGLILVAFNAMTFSRSIAEVRDDSTGRPVALAALDHLALVNAAISALSVAVLAALAFKFFLPLNRILAVESEWLNTAEVQQLADNARRRSDAEIHEALEFGSDDARLATITNHILCTMAPDHPSELLLADSSNAHMTTWASNRDQPEPGCDVASPFECPAVKRSRAYMTSTSESISSCPHLRGRASGPCAARCVPVAFMGQSLGVLHLTGAEGDVFDDELIHRSNTLAEELGTRIGTVRAFTKAQLQASTDSLTGLDNRRAIENTLNERLGRGHHFAIAIADLDQFKVLNDTHGHDIGDRALRAFARAVRSALREGDLFARWGGEEFVIAIPDLDASDAVHVLHRAQRALAEICAEGSVPTFTVSFGVTDSTSSPHLEHLLRAADEALMRAKKSGRDVVCVAGVDAPCQRPTAPTAPPEVTAEAIPLRAATG